MKNKLLKTGSLLIALFFVVGTAVSQKNDEVKAKIEKINKEMAKAMMEKNSEANLKYYADDAISLPNNSKMIKGKEAIRKSNEEMMKSGFEVKSFESTTTDIQTNGNMITEIGKYKIKLSVPGMEGDMEDEGKYLTIWEQQQDGSLKIKTEIWNTDTNPMENMGMGMEHEGHME